MKFREVVAIRTASKARCWRWRWRSGTWATSWRRAAMEAVALAEKAGSEEREEKEAALESIRVSDERLCIVTLVLPPEVSEPEVLVDNRAGLVDGARVFVDPGARKILVRAGEPFVSEITAKEGERRSLVVPGGQEGACDEGEGGSPGGADCAGAGGLVGGGAGRACRGRGSAALRDAYGACSGPAQEGERSSARCSRSPPSSSGSTQLYAGTRWSLSAGRRLGGGLGGWRRSLGGGAKEPAVMFIVAPCRAAVQASGRF
ncbi:MAG: hypothetical protein R3B70_16365 [Polyangiaceae bacterium]